MVEGGAGNADTALLGNFLEPCRDVDAVAVDILTIDDYVAKIDADAKAERIIVGLVCVAIGEAALELDGTRKSSDNAGEVSGYRIAAKLTTRPP